eukprot:1882798-Heterocapsa_arctica.AAC.1
MPTVASLQRRAGHARLPIPLTTRLPHAKHDTGVTAAGGCLLGEELQERRRQRTLRRDMADA